MLCIIHSTKGEVCQGSALEVDASIPTCTLLNSLNTTLLENVEIIPITLQYVQFVELYVSA